MDEGVETKADVYGSYILKMFWLRKKYGPYLVVVVYKYRLVSLVNKIHVVVQFLIVVGWKIEDCSHQQAVKS